MENLTKKALESLFDLVISAAGKRRRLAKRIPFGLNPFADVRRTVKDYEFTVIFDIGANVGQSAKWFRRMDGRARILSFEPVAETFQELQKNTAQLPNHERHQLAFGERARQAVIELAAKSTFNSLLNATAGDHPAGKALATIEISTVDAFCHEHSIDRISFLKSDTEGYEMQVMQGAAGALAESRVDFLQIELGFDPANKKHVPFSAMKEHLEAKGYVVFGLYHQTLDWGGRPILRFADVLFASPAIVARASAG